MSAPGPGTLAAPRRLGRRRAQRPGQRERAATRAAKLMEELGLAEEAARQAFLSGPTGDGLSGGITGDSPSP
eukprot:8679631-Alexandrium_andersonii.AAC.1